MSSFLTNLGNLEPLVMQDDPVDFHPILPAIFLLHIALSVRLCYLIVLSVSERHTRPITTLMGPSHLLNCKASL